MELNFKRLECSIEGMSAGWIRLGIKKDRIARWTTDKPLFSERNGYTIPVLKIKKWRLFLEKDNQVIRKKVV